MTNTKDFIVLYFFFFFTDQILDKRALQELVKEVDPSEQLDEDVEDVCISNFLRTVLKQLFILTKIFLKILLQIADDFIENVINSSCQLAKHRKSNILEAKDVQFHLGRQIFFCK